MDTLYPTTLSQLAFYYPISITVRTDHDRNAIHIFAKRIDSVHRWWDVYIEYDSSFSNELNMMMKEKQVCKDIIRKLFHEMMEKDELSKM